MALDDAAWGRLALEDAVLVEVERTQGSVPREAGTWMLVFAEALVCTIGGGHLEYQAIATARAMLAGAPSPDAAAPVRYALGPSLGQCCGGVVHLRYTRVGVADVPQLRTRLAPRRWPVALFGGGHVGTALARGGVFATTGNP